jgi:hypothetical protein
MARWFTLDEARSAKQHVLSVFAPLVDVVGVGVTREGPGYAVKVNLRSPPPLGVKLPRNVGGIPVRVEVVGFLAKQKALR